MQIIRSFGVLVLTLFLFSGSIGFEVFTHTCKEDGVSTAYVINTINHCEEHLDDLPPCCKAMHQEDDCCNDEISFYQIKLDFFQNHQHHIFQSVATFLPVIQVENDISLQNRDINLTAFYQPPPPPDNGRRRAFLQIYTI